MSLLPQRSTMPVTLPADVLDRYRRVTLYNSPFIAHDHGCAVDLYPGDATHPDPGDGPPVDAPAPVAGEVLDTRTVTAPAQPYAAARDHLILVDTAVGDGSAFDAAAATETAEAPIARIMHVDPAVEAGDRVAVGDSLGTLVRAGFFAPWVANHLHLGFRPRGTDPYRASGSLLLALDPQLDVRAVPWDGTGTVVATGDTYAVLDTPAHPAPGAAFAGIAASVDGRVVGALDGGLPHYDGGGLLGVGDGADDGGTPLSLSGRRVGVRRERNVSWDALTVRANGDSVRGIALALERERLGVRLVGETIDLAVGTDVTVAIDRA
jgi:hypothetical protein